MSSDAFDVSSAPTTEGDPAPSLPTASVSSSAAVDRGIDSGGGGGDGGAADLLRSPEPLSTLTLTSSDDDGESLGSPKPINGRDVVGRTSSRGESSHVRLDLGSNLGLAVTLPMLARIDEFERLTGRLDLGDGDDGGIAHIPLGLLPPAPRTDAAHVPDGPPSLDPSVALSALDTNDDDPSDPEGDPPSGETDDLDADGRRVGGGNGGEFDIEPPVQYEDDDDEDPSSDNAPSTGQGQADDDDDPLGDSSDPPSSHPPGDAVDQAEHGGSTAQSFVADVGAALHDFLLDGTDTSRTSSSIASDSGRSSVEVNAQGDGGDGGSGEGLG